MHSSTPALPRITIRGLIRGNVSGFSLTSRDGGLFGTKIFVRHLSSALCIKATMRRLPAGAERSAEIDKLIHWDASR